MDNAMEELYEMNNLCRICLNNHLNYESIFSIKSDEIHGDNVEFWKIMRLHGGIEVFMNDGLPQTICSPCASKCLAAHTLWKQCQEADKKLREYYKKPPSYPIQKDKSSQTDVSLQDQMKDESTKTDDKLEKIASCSDEKLISESLEASRCQQNRENQIENIPNDETMTDCQICYKKFTKLRSLIRHLNFHKNNNFSGVYRIIKGIRDRRRDGNQRTEESEERPEQRREAEDLRDNPLNSPKTIIKQINMWIREELVSTAERLFTCALCNQSYLSKKSLIRHQENLHKIPEEPKIIKENKCITCGEIFKTEFKLKKHMKSHENSKSPGDLNFKRFLCDICSKTFRQRTGLTFHMRTHTGDKPFVCKFCDRRFTSSSNRINHERTHTGARPFVCHFCSAAFAKSCTLKAHITTHTGEANYHCKTCGKSFRRLKYLKEHRFTHTGEKPYVCKICGTAYSHSGSLFVHEKKCKAQLGNFGDACHKNIEEILGS